MSNTLVYSKVLIRVPSDYISTQKDGSLLIKCPSRKYKSSITTSESTESIESKPKRKAKFEKGSDAAKEFMKMIREKRLAKK